MKAVLFDFDGTLADTMEDNFIAWSSAFNSFNVKIKREDYFPLEGLKLIDVARKIGISQGLPLHFDFQKIVDVKNARYLEINNFRLYPRVEEIVGKLKEKYKLAIVTASPREKIEKTAGDFLKNFDVIVTSEDYLKGKPDAEPYKTAMRKLVLENKECIVIENAPLGIESAKNAGCYCIAVCSTCEKKELFKADKVVNKIEDILEFVY